LQIGKNCLKEAKVNYFSIARLLFTLLSVSVLEIELLEKIRFIQKRYRKLKNGDNFSSSSS